MKTLIGLFDDRKHANQAQKALVALGLSKDKTAVFEQDTMASQQRSNQPLGWWDRIKEALGFGFEETEASYYREGLQRGGTLLSVRADDDLEDGIIEVMNRNGAVDIDERAVQWKSAGWTPDAGEIRMPVVKEELRIGKRQITSGGIRVYSQVTETPVEEEIGLREQRVTVDRRPVDRSLTPGEAAFEDEAIEVTESHEEPIISKAARVTEEVVVKKENTERTETVRDTVRRKDVEVEKAGTDDKGAGKIRKAG